MYSLVLKILFKTKKSKEEYFNEISDTEPHPRNAPIGGILLLRTWRRRGRRGPDNREIDGLLDL